MLGISNYLLTRSKLIVMIAKDKALLPAAVDRPGPLPSDFFFFLRASAVLSLL